MSKSYRLTQAAEDSLDEIAIWTFETFGPRQADRYEAALKAKVLDIAAGRVVARDCSVLTGSDAGRGLSYVSAGEHFVVFLDVGQEIIVIDVLHSRSNLPSVIAALDL